jgi:cyclic-di-GMP-binding biofilm dispersal mediator protein
MSRTVDLANKRVLIVGGSGVLGSSIGRELSQHGATVMLAGRDATRLQQRATEIGRDVRSAVFDLTIDEHIDHLVATSVETMGGIDGVVNAAGVVAFGPLRDLDATALDRMVATNLTGPLKLVRAALPHLSDGFVVNISGVVAETPVAGMAAYSAVKAGLSSASIALGRELRREGVHVLDARPPHTETGLAGRPIDGVSPNMPHGLDPVHVSKVIVAGLAAGKRELAAGDFEPA